MIRRLLTTTIVAIVLVVAGCSSAVDEPRPGKPGTDPVPDRYKGSAVERAKIVQQEAEAWRAEIPWISVEEIDGRIARGEPVRIVNIKAAIDEPLVNDAIVVDATEIDVWASRAPKAPPIVTYCSCTNDGSAVVAALRLRELGFEGTRVLRGGLAAWQQAGLPVSNVR